MLRRRTLVMVAAVLTAGALVGCGESDDVRSDSGPTAQESTSEPDGSTSDGSEVGSEETTTTTTEPPEAVPATSPVVTVVGNVQIPEGEPGALSVVLVGTADANPDRPTGTVPVVVRNRTANTIYSIEASATARAADGSLAGSGSSQGFAPSRVEPGEWAFGFVYFSSDLPPDATFEVTATGEDDDSFVGSLDVKPVETNQVPGEYTPSQVVGIVSNEHGEQVDGPISVTVACFDDAGTTIRSVHGSYTDADSIAAGGTASFSVDVFDGTCPNYAVGASGYNF